MSRKSMRQKIAEYQKRKARELADRNEEYRLKHDKWYQPTQEMANGR